MTSADDCLHVGVVVLGARFALLLISAEKGTWSALARRKPSRREREWSRCRMVGKVVMKRRRER